MQGTELNECTTSGKHHVVDEIVAFNAGRDPERLTRKYRLLASNPFAFLRGTCHLFYQDYTPPCQAPLAWICGDLHLENFGTYKGDNRLSYFDLNDFDEAALAPASWELSRFLVSLLLAADVLRVRRRDALFLCRRFLDTYGAELATGKARWLERATARGMIKALMRDIRTRSRPAFLDRRTDIRNGKRRLRLDGVKALPVAEAERARVTALMAHYAATQTDQKFFKVLDVARRIAGTGSLGLERYVVLLRGRGGMDGNFLLDIKNAPASALAPWLPCPQPAWDSEAQRIVAVQRRVQAITPAFLTDMTFDGQSYVLKELLPDQDRLTLDQWDGKLARLEAVVCDMGALLAWAHLRSGGRQGSANADAWIAFGADVASWRTPLLEHAQASQQRVLADWKSYAGAYREAERQRGAKPRD
ncbi:DUF2252 domain-containing protein [Rugamonas apoptosis]|uniref:DUF2252 domain-containing protein n=1 Tax=Rugamonas apoptosis TaxID=2758570 RepID=A0A7W2FBG2_9BURK|nr:DUF2252 domain-containing protein [Rugamonas apoptosis]MBA5688641.1 DUF2252 domain-containing protein [Rugamonas apoptosis]